MSGQLSLGDATFTRRLDRAAGQPARGGVGAASLESVVAGGRRFYGQRLADDTLGRVGAGWPLDLCSDCGLVRWVAPRWAGGAAWFGSGDSSPPTPPNKDGPRERPTLLDMDHYDNCALSDGSILESVGEFWGLFRYEFVQFDYSDNYFIYVVYK